MVDISNSVDFDFIANVFMKHMGVKRGRARWKKMISTYKNYLDALDIKNLVTNDNIYISREDGERFEKFYASFRFENYYSHSQVCTLLGIRQNALPQALYKLVKPFYFKGLRYFDKDEINYYIDMRRNTLSTREILKKFNFNEKSISVIKQAINKLKSKGIYVEIIPSRKHPFGNQVLIKNYERLIEYLQYREKIESLTDKYELLCTLTESIDFSSHIAKKTFEEFHMFVKERYNRVKMRSIVYSHVRILENLVKFLYKDLMKYSKEEIETLVNKLKNLKDAKRIDEFEFIMFVNYCNNKYRNIPLPSLKFDKKSTPKNIKTAYTTKQWEDFRKVVFGRIDDRETLLKALNSRTLATSWLYIALHYVTAWRKSTMMEMPFPSLELIGFNNGADFLSFMKNGGIFTTLMGEIIYKNILDKINAFGKKANKNSGVLVFAVGESKVRQIGLLIAICEAHRQTVRTICSNKNVLITEIAANRECHIELFGDIYEEIFGEETFENTRATKSQLHHVEKWYNSEGIYLASVLRGHTAIPGKYSGTTADIYLTHAYQNKDDELGNITYNMHERGIFSCIPYLLLNTLNIDFSRLSYQEQTNRIQKLSLSPMQIEQMNKVVLQQGIKIRNLIDKIIKSDTNIIEEVLNKIVFGECYSKHFSARCLLKAFPIEQIPKIITCDITKVIENNRCIYENKKDCIGCEFLIAEKLFLIEVNDKFQDTINRIELSICERDVLRYQYLLKILKNIMLEAVIVLGKDNVFQYINEETRNKLVEVEKKKLVH